MITVELDRLLVHLAKVETGLSRVYERLSKKENFRPQVQGFWFIDDLDPYSTTGYIFEIPANFADAYTGGFPLSSFTAYQFSPVPLASAERL